MQYRLATLASVAISSAVVTACAITYFQRRTSRLAVRSGRVEHQIDDREDEDATCQSVTSNPLWESPDDKRASVSKRGPTVDIGRARGGRDNRDNRDGGKRRSDPYDPRPRSDYLSWDDYFMAVAFLSSQRYVESTSRRPALIGGTRSSERDKTLSVPSLLTPGLMCLADSCIAVRRRSKDPNKQVGACIVDQQNVICGIGYNGFPRGCPDSKLPWSKLSKSGSKLDTKYPYVCHAEMNAILNKNNSDVAGSKVYVTMFPCNECAKLMIQAGIAEIVFHEDKVQPKAETPGASNFKLADQYTASKKLLALAGVKIRQHLFKRDIRLTLTNDGIVGMDAMDELFRSNESTPMTGNKTSLVTRFD